MLKIRNKSKALERRFVEELKMMKRSLIEVKGVGILFFWSISYFSSKMALYRPLNKVIHRKRQKSMMTRSSFSVRSLKSILPVSCLTWENGQIGTYLYKEGYLYLSTSCKRIYYFIKNYFRLILKILRHWGWFWWENSLILSVLLSWTKRLNKWLNYKFQFIHY